MGNVKIRTTHTGSLPRTPEALAALRGRDSKTLKDPMLLETTFRDAVATIVRKQVETGIDIVNDGETSKIGYATYIKERLTGFDGESRLLFGRIDDPDFPEFFKKFRESESTRSIVAPACTGPITWKDKNAVQTDIDNLKAAKAGAAVGDIFMTAASPGVVSMFMENKYYSSDEAYLSAVAAVMRDEYRAITDAGFILQIDCPDLAAGRSRFASLDIAAYNKRIGLHIDAINEAIKDIPPDRVRLHLCWGNYEGPHHRDVPLKDIIKTVFTANVSGFSFEGANPRHEHEWAIFREIKLPPGKYLIPGVIDSTTNYVEHPELVAQRLQRYAELVGPDNVIASTDCGLDTFAGAGHVDPKIAWAKLRSMVEGAALALRLL